MKKQFPLILMLLAILVTAPNAFGQKKAKSSRADAQLADLTTKLNLTDNQKAKIKPILDDEASKIHVIKEDKTLSKDDQKAKTKPIRDAATQQIRAALTSDQQKIYNNISKKGEKKAAPAPGL